MKMILVVAAGGAFGAVARYLTMIQVGHLFGTGFPYGTIAVNVIGSFIMGTLVEALALYIEMSQEMRAMLVVGVLGSFTTFSTFSLDTVLLVERGAWAGAAFYIAVSVALSIGAFVAGLYVLRVFAP